MQGVERFQADGTEGGNKAAQEAHSHCQQQAQLQRGQVDREPQHDIFSAAGTARNNACRGDAIGQVTGRSR